MAASQDLRDGATLTLIRHGKIADGGVQRMSGWTDLPLSEAGRRQAQLLAGRLRRDGRTFQAMYSSPLQRAADTAQALSVSSATPVQYLDDLKEIDCGGVDGLAVAETQRLYPAYWAANLRQDDEEFRWPGGESYRAFRDRCLGAVAAIARAWPGRSVAVVTHAGVISQICGALRGLSPAQWEPYRPANASLTEIAWQGVAGAIVSFDDRAHLQAEAATSAACSTR